MSSDTLCATGKEPISFRAGTIRLDNPFGMPDFFSSGILSFLDSTPSFAVFFLVDAALVCDFLPAISGVDVFCVVDLNLVSGRKVGVGEGTM